MIKKIHFLLILFLVSNIFSQKKLISGKIIDFTTNKGIPNVHIYSPKLNAGTITNADGSFYIIVSKNDELHISCIGFENQIIKIEPNFDEKFVLKMNQKVESLDEIVISAKKLTVDEILNKVFNNFKKNHFVEPAYYNFYSRITDYIEKDSMLISLEEYSGKIKQGKLHYTKYNIDKARVKFFGKDAKLQLKDHRLISMSKMSIDNIYRYREDYIKKKGKRIYKYKLIKKSNILGRNCYVITFNTDKSTYYKKGELYIDIEDYAIIRKKLINSNNKIVNDITFKKQNAKWYLKKAEDYHGIYGALTPTTSYRITLYNYFDIENSDLKFTSLNVNYSTKITSNFNDKFWENTNFIPLPNWIKTQM